MVVFLVVIGVGLYLIDRYVPMNRTIKSILNIVVIVVVGVFVLNAFGVLRAFPRLRIGMGF
jgi:small-conductance mechanosensitive channel